MRGSDTSKKTRPRAVSSSLAGRQKVVFRFGLGGAAVECGGKRCQMLELLLASVYAHLSMNWDRMVGSSSERTCQERLLHRLLVDYIVRPCTRVRLFFLGLYPRIM